MLGHPLLPIRGPLLPNQVDAPPPPSPTPPCPPLRATTITTTTTQYSPTKWGLGRVICRRPLPLPEMAERLFPLIPLEEERTKLQSDIMVLEKRTEDIFTNHISFVLLFTGGGLILNTRLPCTAIATFTTLTLVSLGVAFPMAYRVLRIKSSQMKPAMNTLTERKNELAYRANAIWTSEDAPQTAHNLGRLNESTDLLHPQDLADLVKMRAKVIVNSASITELKKYNCQLIWTIFTCLVVHGSVIYFTAYYSYGYAKKGVKIIWLLFRLYRMWMEGG